MRIYETYRLLVKVKNLFIRLLNETLLHFIDLALAPKLDSQISSPPIFILGAPRCGSTLLVQVLTDAFDIGYISNRHAQFYGSPAIAEYMFHPDQQKAISDFSSTHGATNKPYGPAECGDFWYRFFRKHPSYVDEQDIPAHKLNNFRRSISSLSRACKKPVLFKNLYAANRIKPIAKVLPEALFVIIEKNEIANACSILKARKKASGNYDQWFSLPPKNIQELLKLGSAEQALEQTRSIYRQIKSDQKSAGISHDRILTINYEEFCKDVPLHLSRFSDFLANHGITLNRRFDVPEAFTVPPQANIPKKLQGEISNYIHATKNDANNEFKIKI